MTIRPFLHLPPPPSDPAVRRLFEVVQQMRRGKMECVSEITLTANAATTVLNFKGLSPQSVVIFDPKTANAAAELYGGTMYVLTANRGNDAWTITHANNAQTDRTFQAAVIG
jgi:hypothetical protein